MLLKILVFLTFLGSQNIALAQQLNQKFDSKNHPKANVILSGISFVGGGHFYNSGSMSFRRGMIDKYLFAKRWFSKSN